MLDTFSSSLSGGYRLLLEKVVVKLFVRPDIAIRCALNQTAPTPERVIANYLQGAYLVGTYHTNEFSWRSTDERAVITRETARIPKRLQSYMNQNLFEIRTDTRFDEVIRSCRREERTWINDSVIGLYSEMQRKGWVHSLEAWSGERLAGGLWGIRIGGTFSIMSMFHRENRAGSIVQGALIRMLLNGTLELIDCHQMTGNFQRYGARSVPVEEFISKVVQSLKVNGTHPGLKLREMNGDAPGSVTRTKPEKSEKRGGTGINV